jgi:hypothetical protein
VSQWMVERNHDEHVIINDKDIYLRRSPMLLHQFQTTKQRKLANTR